MKIGAFILFLVLSTLIAVEPARADTDQHCLNACITSGQPSSNCMKSCSYASPHVKQTKIIPGTNHELLEAPIPSGELILKTEPIQAATPGKNFDCFNQCLKDGMQYGLCEQRCTKRSCGPGTDRCKVPTLSTNAAAPAH